MYAGATNMDVEERGFMIIYNAKKDNRMLLDFYAVSVLQDIDKTLSLMSTPTFVSFMYMWSENLAFRKVRPKIS